MNDFVIAAGTCIVTGIITTINPCPLTTTIASIGFLSGYSQKTRHMTMVVLLFLLGFLTSYFVLAILLSSGLIAIPEVSRGLQQSFSLIIGPLLIIVGMFQAKLIKIRFKVHTGKAMTWIIKRKWSGLEAFPMGALIALGFCPTTAAIFFGVLIPLAIRHGQPLLFPLLYALGAVLPLAIISYLIVAGVKTGGNKNWQRLLPVISGWIMILAGIYLAVQRLWL
ncbi:MAG: sulfite exporter TauE/SafE family protein [Bacteroidales bacterium]|nr:sulfite exporter TauE/SafE family protein [Bacteroidales bacterium]